MPNELHPDIVALVEVMNLNNSRATYTPYAGFEITETRKKYHLLNSVSSNGQRSGLFLIDRNTLEVYRSRAYGKAGNRHGTVASLRAEYEKANASFAAKPSGTPRRTLSTDPYRPQA